MGQKAVHVYCRMAWDVQGKISLQPIEAPLGKQRGGTQRAVVLGSQSPLTRQRDYAVHLMNFFDLWLL